MQRPSESTLSPGEPHTVANRLSRRAVLAKALLAGTAAVVAGTSVVDIARAHDGGAEDTLCVTTAALNLRTGPGTGYRVILVMPKGATINLQRRYENGFDYVSYKGRLGWAHRDYIVARTGGSTPDPVIVGSATTTANVNLRRGPSTGHPVIQVIVKGATVSITDRVQNGYRYIYQHSGPGGWVIDSALSGAGQPGETFTTTARLNLRAGPSLDSTVMLVMPEGAVVTAGSGTAPGFRQITYRGTTGWASTNYLN